MTNEGRDGREAKGRNRTTKMRRKKYEKTV